MVKKKNAKVTMHAAGTTSVRARTARLGALCVSASESSFFGVFGWARRLLDGQKRRFPARAVQEDITNRKNQGEEDRGARGCI
jgi:hypothetical protein